MTWTAVTEHRAQLGEGPFWDSVNDRLLLGLKGTMSEAELHLLAGRPEERLILSHRAESRSIFARGALAAAGSERRRCGKTLASSKEWWPLTKPQ